MEELDKNIRTLRRIESDHREIDNYYQQLFREDCTKKKAAIELSQPGKQYKLGQIGFSLACEYLRNVGYDIPKPDRHICRILGKDYLALSEKQPVKEEDAFDIVVDLARKSGKSVAETDYILWSYCANGYGEICTIKLKCEKCVVEICSLKK